MEVGCGGVGLAGEESEEKSLRWVGLVWGTGVPALCCLTWNGPSSPPDSAAAPRS